MASLVERISQMRGELEAQAAGLRKQLADVEAGLARFQAAEQVVARLLDQEQAPQPTPTQDAADQRSTAGPIGTITVPHRTATSQVADLPAAYRQLIDVAEHASGPVRCKDVCTAPGDRLPREAVVSLDL